MDVIFYAGCCHLDIQFLSQCKVFDEKREKSIASGNLMRNGLTVDSVEDTEPGSELVKTGENLIAMDEDLMVDGATGVVQDPREILGGENFKFDKDATKGMDDLISKDADINDIADTSINQFVAADAKLNFDDNAGFGQKHIVVLLDPSQEDPREVVASKADLNYIVFDRGRFPISSDEFEGKEESGKQIEDVAKVEDTDELLKRLTNQLLKPLESLPQVIQEQLMHERGPHGIVDVVKIETEKMLFQMDETELEKIKLEGHMGFQIVGDVCKFVFDRGRFQDACLTVVANGFPKLEKLSLI